MGMTHLSINELIDGLHARQPVMVVRAARAMVTTQGHRQAPRLSCLRGAYADVHCYVTGHRRCVQ